MGDITITAEKGRLSEDEIERMVREAEEFADEDAKLRENVEARNQFEAYAYQMRSTKHWTRRRRGSTTTPPRRRRRTSLMRSGRRSRRSRTRSSRRRTSHRNNRMGRAA